MFLSKHKNGFYYVIYDTLEGKRSRISTKCKLKSEAHKYLAEFAKQLEEKNARKHAHIDLRSFTYKYFRYSESTHSRKTTDSYAWIFKEFINFLGNPLLHEISFQQIGNYINYKRKVSAFTAQKHLAYLRSAFNYALKQNYILVNHFSNIKNYRLPEKQPKYFSQEEYQMLINSIHEEWFKNIIEFAYNTGMRQGEILNLDWKEVDMINDHISISNQSAISKSKRIRVIPLNRRAKEIILSLQKEPKQFVFNYFGQKIKQDHISKKFKKHVKRININQSLNFHSLRHTFASRLAQKGVSIYHISKLLGHASITTTQIYAHLNTNDLKTAIKLLD
jgi:integrase